MKRLSEVLAAEGKTADEIKEELSGTVEKYQGETLVQPIVYTFDPLQYVDIDEAKKAGVWPNDADTLNFINRQKFTSDKQAAYQKATAAQKEIYEKTPEFRKKTLIAALVAGGFGKDEAEALAAQKIK